MGQCKKCNVFLPPGYVHETDPIDGTPLACPTCEFCLKNISVIHYEQGKQVSKRELEREYKVFMKRIKEDSNVLKNIVKEKGSGVPSTLL